MGSRLTLVLGGIRSGKSAFAEKLANESCGSVLYVATGQATDGEMAERIRLHRERRPANWQTVEEPLNPASVLPMALTDDTLPCCMLLDSVDTWVANLLLAHEDQPEKILEGLALAELDRLLETCHRGETRAVLVSSETGLSPVAPNRLGRRFQDLLGTVNQRIAAAADEVYLVVAGIPWKIKSEGNEPPSL